MTDEHSDQELIKTLTRYFEDKQQLQLQEKAQTLAAEGRSPQASEYLRAVVDILYSTRGAAPPPRRGFFDLFSPFTLVVAFMTVVFGMLGLAPTIFGLAQNAGAPFLDIAKIFAGAVVGATSNTIATATRRSTPRAPEP